MICFVLLIIVLIQSQCNGHYIKGPSNIEVLSCNALESCFEFREESDYWSLSRMIAQIIYTQDYELSEFSTVAVESNKFPTIELKTKYPFIHLPVDSSDQIQDSNSLKRAAEWTFRIGARSRDVLLILYPQFHEDYKPAAIPANDVLNLVKLLAATELQKHNDLGRLYQLYEENYLSQLGYQMLLIQC